MVGSTALEPEPLVFSGSIMKDVSCLTTQILSSPMKCKNWDLITDTMPSNSKTKGFKVNHNLKPPR